MGWMRGASDSGHARESFLAPVTKTASLRSRLCRFSALAQAPKAVKLCRCLSG